MQKFLNTHYIPGFLSNVSSLFGGRALSLLFQFVSGIILARLLGPELKGVLTVALVVPGMVLSLADLGLRQATMFFMGKKKYPDQDLISSGLFTTFFTSVLGITSALAFYLLTGSNAGYSWLIMVIPLGIIPATFFYSYSTGILLAKLEIRKVAFSNVLSDAGFLLLISTLYTFKVNNLELILAGKVICALIPSFVTMTMIKKYGRIIPSYKPNLIKELLRKGIVYAIALFLLGLNYNLDIVILGKVTNSAEVGIYSIGVSIANILWMMPNALTTVNFSYSSNAQSEAEYAQKTTLILRLTLIIALVLLLLLYLISPYLIPRLYTSEFERSVSVVQTILPGVWLMLIYKILNSDLAGRGKPGAGIWVCFLAITINVLLNFWWDPIYGAIGSAWASNVSYGIATILYTVIYSRLSKIEFFEIFRFRISDLRMISTSMKSYISNMTQRP